jgi:hypothetical protein
MLKEEKTLKEFCKANDIKFRAAYGNFDENQFFNNLELVHLRKIKDDEIPEYAIYEAIKRHGMTEQCLVKSSPSKKVFDLLENLAPDLPFIPIVKENFDCREELTRIIRDYGEEKLAYRIADNICRSRAVSPIMSTGELVEIIRNAYPDHGRSMKHHPAMRTFQAIRIEVNGELEIIPQTVRDAVSLLAPGGRLAIITFHSLEDRAVKEPFVSLAQGCTCPRDFPICVCGKTPDIKIITKKPIISSPSELKDNPRAHSAKLRVAEKL